ncbi:AI-2E family transporter [Abiotrophia defectiva]|uniref:AI-2E family transporter n=1 Tax=Abiotrophia defectiva TaxID=46125 RepID=UPI00228213BE|nr:AI-2E family transporter [Abiotrophia defectiva]MCY7224728.1 AI-2E family transporter [Abiotrophia defectiva]
MARYDKYIMKYIGLVTLIVLGVWNWNSLMGLVGSIYKTLGPIINGAIFAYILNLLMVRYEGLLTKVQGQVPGVKSLKRPVSMFLSLLTFVLAVIMILVLVLPQLSTAISRFIEVIPGVSTWLQRAIEEYDAYFPQLQTLMSQLNINWGSLIQQSMTVLNTLSSNFLNITFNTITGVASNTINSILSLMVALYILGSKERLLLQGKRVIMAYLKPSHAQTLLDIIRLMNESFTNFFVGMTLEGIILGSLVTVAASIFNLPYAGMLGVIAGVMALIPIIGGYISAAVGTLMLLAVSPSQALFYLIMVIIIMQLEGNLIYPRVVGGSIGLPGLWVLVAFTVGGGLMGISGMILGIPLAATLYKLLGRDVLMREKRQTLTILE